MFSVTNYENGTLDWNSLATGNNTNTVTHEAAYHGNYGVDHHRVDDFYCFLWGGLPAVMPNCFARNYFKFTKLPGAGEEIELFYLISGFFGYQLQLTIQYVVDNPYWKLRIFENSVESSFVSTVVPTINTWYCVEIQRDVTNDIQKVWIDGRNILSTNVAISLNTEQTYFGITATYLAGDYHVYTDELIISDNYIEPIEATPFMHLVQRRNR
jgi:hypothetical protein